VGKVYVGGPDGTGMRVAIVTARFNELVTNALLNGARGSLIRNGVSEDDIDTVSVPGSFELAPTALRLAQTGRYDAIICIGVVIRGDTAHFEYVANGTTNGISRVSLDTGVPVIFGVLTTENLEQALARAGGHIGNKGADAAQTAIEMVNLYRQLDGEKTRHT
jgi:6,7-dimethyl-8-ribityllumazine synthase